MEQSNQLFFSLLRTAMTGKPFEPVPSAQEWSELYEMADRQSVMGVCYTALSRLSGEQKPPLDLMMQWMAEAETIRGLNELQNHEAARLTQLFSEQGRKTAILKGQANARLYPDPFSRQPGDIDIWVEGGKERVVALLREMGLMDGMAKTIEEGRALASNHHVHLPVNENGVVVEIHFRPTSGNFNPLTNRRLQRWLKREILSLSMVEEEYYVPSIRFALVMQLSHIQYHFLVVGLGLRQVCDYYWLLKRATEEDRQAVASIIKPFGLRHTAGALMWVLGEVLHLEEKKMYCQKDSYRGEWMLREMMAGGNFGKYNKRQKHGFVRRFAEARLRQFRLMRFDFWEVLWLKLRFWERMIVTLPLRIKYRKLILRDIQKR